MAPDILTPEEVGDGAGGDIRCEEQKRQEEPQRAVFCQGADVIPLQREAGRSPPRHTMTRSRIVTAMRIGWCSAAVSGQGCSWVEDAKRFVS
jgi:hypothetical protein